LSHRHFDLGYVRQLTSTSAATYTYDLNGNNLTKTDTNGTTYYTWDYENRLTSVTLPGTGGTVYFTYDPFGRRVRKVFTGATTIYSYDGDNVVEAGSAEVGALRLPPRFLTWKYKP